MFMSLDVLHHPDEFGLRGAWAAGVRSRVPAPERETLQQARLFYKGPIYWVYTLPAPKDSATVLEAMEQIPAAERLRVLTFFPNVSPQVKEVLENVAARQSWSTDDQKTIRAAFQNEKIPLKDVSELLDMWTQPEEFGRRYLAALQAYRHAFFAEEEKRIHPALQAAVKRSQALAKRLAVPDLLEEISEGLHLPEASQVAELVLIPSFWVTPLVAFIQVSDERMLFMFGGRPADASLVPGESVPDSLQLGLKALADPTRLRILRYLTTEPLTPAQLARRLRLRAPTVVHHLRALRLAGLVHLTLESGRKVHYAARSEAVDNIFTILQDFLEQD